MDRNSCIIIVGEGGYPTDLPKSELFEFLSIKAKLDSNIELNDDERKKFEELKIKIERWERNFRNDEYFHSLIDLTNFINIKFKIKTFYSFLNYCEPNLIKTIENAISSNYKKIYLFSTKFILKQDERLKIEDEINLIKMKYKDIVIENFTELNFNEISDLIYRILEKEGE